MAVATPTGTAMTSAIAAISAESGSSAAIPNWLLASGKNDCVVKKPNPARWSALSDRKIRKTRISAVIRSTTIPAPRRMPRKTLSLLDGLETMARGASTSGGVCGESGVRTTAMTHFLPSFPADPGHAACGASRRYGPCWLIDLKFPRYLGERDVKRRRHGDDYVTGTPSMADCAGANLKAPPTVMRSAAPSVAGALVVRSGHRDVEGRGESADGDAPLEDGRGQAGIQSLGCPRRQIDLIGGEGLRGWRARIAARRHVAVDEGERSVAGGGRRVRASCATGAG